MLTSVGCRDGRIAMVGSKSGGAHGNPRVSTWYQRSDGALVDLDAAFELYGGPLAVSVGKIAAGPDGWLIAGNLTSGAAVWVSRDATEVPATEEFNDLEKVVRFGALDDDGRAAPFVSSLTVSGGDDWHPVRTPTTASRVGCGPPAGPERCRSSLRAGG